MNAPVCARKEPPIVMTVYADIANPDLLDRIPLNAARVLDVGCGGGALGSEFKRRNPSARVYGIESDADMAAVAAARQAPVESAHTPSPGAHAVPPSARFAG